MMHLSLKSITPQSTSKRCTALLFATLLALTFAVPSASAQWVKTNGDIGGEVRSFTSIGQYLFAGTSWGVFRSSDFGDSWTVMNDSLGWTDVNVVYAKDGMLFAGTFSGLYRSTDLGASWKEIDKGMLNIQIQTLASIDTVLFAGAYDGFFASTDNGDSWSTMSSSLEYANVATMAVVNKTVLFAHPFGLMRSTNYGLEWTADTSIRTWGGVYSMIVMDTELFAGSIGQVFRSSDDGKSWSHDSARVTDPIHGGYVYLLALGKADATLLASTDNGLIKSSDRGRTWFDDTAGIGKGEFISFYRYGQYMFGGNGGGVWRKSVAQYNSVPMRSQSSSLDQLLINTDGLRIDIRYHTSTDIDRPKIEVCDILGKLVFTTTLESAASGWNRASIALPSLPGGTYVCRVSGGGFSASSVVRLGN